MQDTNHLPLHFMQTTQQEIEKQRFFQQLFQPSNIRNPFASYDTFQLSPSARRILETVLVNSNIAGSSSQVNAVPSSKDEFGKVTQSIIENEKQSSINIAHQLRSMAELVKYDNKLYKILVKYFGFSQETRIFHNALFTNSNQIEKEDDLNIGIVYLKDFMIYFGLIYELFNKKEEPMMKSRLVNYQIQDNKDDLTCNILEQINQDVSLISPLCSQQIQEAKQIEANSIVKVFESTQIQSLCKNKQLFDTTQNNWNQNKSANETEANNEGDNGVEDLLAHEDLQLEEPSLCNFNQNNNFYQNPHLFQPHRVNQYPYRSSSIQDMLRNIKQKPIKQQQQSKKEHQTNQSFDKNSIDKIRYFQDVNQYQQNNNRLFNDQSLISGNSSRLNTPMTNFKSQITNLYSNNSEIKPKTSSRILFNSSSTQNNQNGHHHDFTPQNTSLNTQKDFYTQPKALFQRYHQESASNSTNNKDLIGLKRHGSNIDSLERSVSYIKEEEGYTTPMTKRPKIDQSTKSKFTIKEENEKEEESANKVCESEDEKENDEANDDKNNISASRKKRGLKILSVKVQELVFDKKKTTYKDVANELIKQLRDNKKNMQELIGNDGDESADNDGDDEEMSDESPNKRGNLENNSTSSQQKWEKNVRRRVYDALNVLYAAGVLKKEGKHVSCDTQIFELTKKQSDRSQQSSNKSSAVKNNPTPQEQRMLQQIDILKQQLQIQKQRVEGKREALSDQFRHYISYRHLIERNETQKLKGYYDPSKQISLPFILVTTKDCPDNEVEISFADSNRSLNIAMKKPMKCIGDADALMKLGFYKVSQEWFDKNMPEFNSALNSLSYNQRSEIII